MDISRKTDYALRMLAMLAEEPERLLSVRTAAEEVNVPYSFARSIQHGLVQAGIVESLRGVHAACVLKSVRTTSPFVRSSRPFRALWL